MPDSRIHRCTRYHRSTARHRSICCSHISHTPHTARTRHTRHSGMTRRRKSLPIPRRQRGRTLRLAHMWGGWSDTHIHRKTPRQRTPRSSRTDTRTGTGPPRRTPPARTLHPRCTPGHIGPRYTPRRYTPRSTRTPGRRMSSQSRFVPPRTRRRWRTSALSYRGYRPPHGTPCPKDSPCPLHMREWQSNSPRCTPHLPLHSPYHSYIGPPECSDRSSS